MADDAKHTVYERGILWLDGGDTEMASAVSEARRTFNQYREKLETDASSVEDCGVKVFFPHPTNPRAGEHMWVNEVTFETWGLEGTLCNDPGWLRGPAHGGRVPFTLDRVSDWFFVARGVVHGGFTIKLLLRQFTPDQFAECRADPPACNFADWYAERRSKAGLCEPNEDGAADQAAINGSAEAT